MTVFKLNGLYYNRKPIIVKTIHPNRGSLCKPFSQFMRLSQIGVTNYYYEFECTLNPEWKFLCTAPQVQGFFCSINYFVDIWTELNG